ncbi:hypothetical protein Tco_0396977, partial [Tanacetum coccineum]
MILLSAFIGLSKNQGLMIEMMPLLIAMEAKNQNLDLIKKTQVLEKENKKLNDLLKKKDKKIESLKSENEELEDEMKEMVEENQGLKNELEEIKKVNDESLKKVRVYEKRVLDFDVRVSGLEKSGKELMDLPDFSDKQKNHVL